MSSPRPHTRNRQRKGSFSSYGHTPHHVQLSDGSGSATPSSPSSLREEVKVEPAAAEEGEEEYAPVRLVVFSGGTACNALTPTLQSLSSSHCTYILPISDNGGSTAEILRVLGGPGIGDIRSRLVRLIPDPPGVGGDAVRVLMSYRLPEADKDRARMEWNELVEGRHALWNGVPSEKRELIRSFFSVVGSEISKRSRPPHNTFDFRNGSIGNLFLTGARLFFGSLESAIFLFASICGVAPYTSVLPVTNTQFAMNIAAILEDGTLIAGQSQISHPTPTHITPRDPSQPSSSTVYDTDEDELAPPGTLRGLVSTPDPHVPTKSSASLALSSPITRIHYISSYGHEILPAPNPKVVRAVEGCTSIIYSIGSLYTSIIPTLVVRGVGRRIKERDVPKVLLLNSTPDRETGGMTATDFLRAIVRACLESQLADTGIVPVTVSLATIDSTPWSSYITHVVYLRESRVRVDVGEIRGRGVECIGIGGRKRREGWVFEGEGLGMVLDVVCGGGRNGHGEEGGNGGGRGARGVVVGGMGLERRMTLK
ncbi:UPF0052-domain-containing protein [Saitoella complicata NRRL Y-17804]|uniref:UPF0052-domain-containing protein n=1 Tax=Saitoella complicata (strain BCRC 22490 / CBS 7301 / JCM 7358 / NBRC 10748 / NRRL Y-17804) TaxID=698492 RepID=UPI0008671EA9|nr:UPF0052-domain-containing protein [Saitoella complicata NRRL Y-17804]ODQ50056.1 UPF0052-domain-containing protein [Saitoella complicata NRRL Y-17804]